jgi:hypothetical protein
MASFLACIVFGLDVIIVSLLGGLTRLLMHMTEWNNRLSHALFAKNPIEAVVYHHTCGQLLPIYEPLADESRINEIKAGFNHFAAAFTSVVTPFPIDAVYDDCVVISDVRSVLPIVPAITKAPKRKQSTLIHWKQSEDSSSLKTASSNHVSTGAITKSPTSAIEDLQPDSPDSSNEELQPDRPNIACPKRRKHCDTNYVEDPGRRWLLPETAAEADVVRRAYIDRGPCQPQGSKPRRQFGKKQEAALFPGPMVHSSSRRSAVSRVFRIVWRSILFSLLLVQPGTEKCIRFWRVHQLEKNCRERRRLGEAHRL